MIQRQQTLWLLLTAATHFLSFLYPFATGKAAVKGLLTDRAVRADSTFLLLLLTGASLALSLVSIFLYKDRKRQGWLCLIGFLLAATAILLYILQVNQLKEHTLALYCVLPFAALVGYFMAYRNIRKDERLVRSLESLR